MRVVSDFPRAICEIEHLLIPLADGCRLAARLWLPDGAERDPVPAIVEYIPYGKRVGTRERDEGMHRWFAGHGYAAVRIDLRGSGESDGVLLDEYLPQEQRDGAEAIAWLAAQPWCSGSVGLMGISWGGFNALQIAALRPPALRAILTACSTDDRYADDVHYMGGCLLNDNLWWGALFFQLCAQPPDPALVGEGWRAQWLARLETAEPHPLRWLRHPLRDAYWKQGSVCERYADIECPVFAVGGWADAYSNAIPRLLANLGSPRRALIGPWGHAYPHEGWPGPAIGFLPEALRFFDRWLRGDKGGGEGEPAFRAWMPEGVPEPSADERPGRWVAEDGWPSERIEPRVLALSPGRLGPRGSDARTEIRSPQTTGRAFGGWVVASLRDQREDDAYSLCFDSEPLAERLEILGAPVVELALSSDRPVAFVMARLCDVSPDGRSTRVSHGLRNLTHAEGHERVELLVPGRRHEVALRLNDVGHAFLPGSRVRLALSTACWPMVWPSPEPVTLTLSTAASRLVLPVRTPRAEDERLHTFEAPARAPRTEWTPVTRGQPEHQLGEEPGSGDLVSRRRSGYDGEGRVAIGRCQPIDLEGGDGMVTETRIHAGDPLRARASMSQRTELRRGAWQVGIESEVVISCTKTEFVVDARLEGHEGERRTFARRWSERVPRIGI